MAVYEYLCPKCRKGFELMRPMSEAEKPAKCPKCGSEAQKLISGLGCTTGSSIQPAGEPFRRNEVDSADCLALSSDSAGDARLLPVSGQYGSEASVGGRYMAQKSLLQQLEDLAGKVRLLEHEKKQAAATIEALERAEKQAAATIEAFEREEKQAAATIQELEREKKQASVTIRGLEREVGELGALIAQASAKVDEMLKNGATADVSQPTAVNAPAESKSLEESVKPSPSQPQDLNRRFSRVYDPTEHSAR